MSPRKTMLNYSVLKKLQINSQALALNKITEKHNKKWLNEGLASFFLN